MAHRPACSRRVQGLHPEQTSDPLGSASVRYGPRLIGFAADLKHRLGVSYRKRSSVQPALTGVAKDIVRRHGELVADAAHSYETCDVRGKICF